MCRRLDAVEATGFADPLEGAEVATLRVLMSVSIHDDVTIIMIIYNSVSLSTIHVLMRDGRKKQARSNKQLTRQTNIAHPRQSLFLRKMSWTQTHDTDREHVL